MPIVLLALAAVMFGLYNVFIKLSADHIQAILGAVVLQFVAAFVGVGLLFYMKHTEAIQISATAKGVWLAVAAGVAIGLVEILTFIIYSRGVPVAVGNPLIIGGSLVVTTGIGVLLLRELLSPLQLFAIVLVIAGIGLLAFEAARNA
ncbi:MAG TPA: hypothetical protein VK032_05050 [Burkholderiaceae bacterium]|nr:hypothetical protein [Burkholderiaceae bacterium]